MALSVSPLTGDNYITAAEAAAVTISGTSRGIADAQAVTIAATDGTNNYAGTATISSDAWTASPVANFSTWDDGTITVTVTLVSDTSINRQTVAILAQSVGESPLFGSALEKPLFGSALESPLYGAVAVTYLANFSDAGNDILKAAIL
ncbi:MAG: hypothetical protein GY942_09735 [Aestuariibacter sp.]|nr:hypothetical protein [Aestuariibacter sp.]